ncbi:MAG: HAD-IIB family hydrolase [Pirellulaceae bacterium]|nr:HAD-IIB family hydrolase [Pirellulaceae bacterium]
MPAHSPPKVLATDLDGTLIPLDGNEQNRRDLESLVTQVHLADAQLVFVTGRHFESVADAVHQYNLPVPQWIICDVGTSIYQNRDPQRRVSDDIRQHFDIVNDYYVHQDKVVSGLTIDKLRHHLSDAHSLRLQETFKQGRFKLSFYANASELDEIASAVQSKLDQIDAPYNLIASVDPFNGDGLLDLLPASVSKSHAIAWWVNHVGLADDQVMFAGDSGNDYAALAAGYRAILVGNADRQLAAKVQQAHQESNFQNRLYLAKGSATSGVLEGWQWFYSQSQPS